MSKKRKLYLTFSNNTPAAVPMSILGVGNRNDITGVQTQYAWDLTAETFTGKNEISIEVRKKGTLVYQVVILPLLTRSVEGVSQALNMSGYGSFAGYQKQVLTWNDTYEFNTLNIYNNNAQTPTMVSQYSNTTLEAGGNPMLVYKNGVQVASVPNNTNGGGSLTVAPGDVLRWTAQEPPSSAGNGYFKIYGNTTGTFYVFLINIPASTLIDQTVNITGALIAAEPAGLSQIYTG